MRGSGRGALHAVHTPQRETGADTAIPAAFVQHVRPPPLRVMARCRLRRAVRLLEPLQLQSAGCPQASRGDACGAGALSARSHRRWRTLCLLGPQPRVRAPGWARPTGRSRPLASQIPAADGRAGCDAPRGSLGSFPPHGTLGSSEITGLGHGDLSSTPGGRRHWRDCPGHARLSELHLLLETVHAQKCGDRTAAPGLATAPAGQFVLKTLGLLRLRKSSRVTMSEGKIGFCFPDSSSPPM